MNINLEFERICQEQGWDYRSQIEVLLRFIEGRGQIWDRKFLSFLRDQQKSENLSLDCGHKDHEDCMICVGCGECDESLDDLGVCSDCREADGV
jgi:hypothetical protein